MSQPSLERKLSRRQAIDHMARMLGAAGVGLGIAGLGGGGSNPPPGGSGGEDHLVLVDTSDSTPDYLSNKLAAGNGIQITTLNVGGAEVEQIAIPDPINVNQGTAGTDPWLVNVSDRATRLLGVIYGDQGQLAQRAVTRDVLAALRVAGVEIDPRDQGAAAALSGAWPVKVTDGSAILGISTNPIVIGGQSGNPGVGSPAQIQIETNTPPSNARGIVTRSVGTQTVSGTVTSNQGAPEGIGPQNAWPILGYGESFLTPGNNVKLQIDDGTFAGFRSLFVEPIGSQGMLLQQDPTSDDLLIQLRSAGVNIDPRDVSDRAARLLGRMAGTVSTGDSTTALLGSNAVFTGAWEEVKDYGAITITIFSDQASAAGGLEFDWSHDGVNVDASSITSVSASAGRAFCITPRGRYFRIKYTNGATGQGIFRLGVVYHPTGTGLISRPYSQSMDQNNYAQDVRAVVDGFDGANFQHIASKTGAPALTDIGLVTRGLVYRNPLLGLYYVESGNLTVLASAHAATAGFFWLVNTSSTVKVYIRSIGFVWSGTAATAFPTSPRITVERVTFTGTPSGAQLTPAKRASTDAANTATLRTASTGLTITAGAVIESFVVGSILTAVGAISVPEEMWQSPDDDGMILLGQNEGIVVRQADAGTAADSRKAVLTLSWEER